MKIKKDYHFKSGGGEYDNYCDICGITSFDHIHRKGTLPKDFERAEEAYVYYRFPYKEMNKPREAVLTYESGTKEVGECIEGPRLKPHKGDHQETYCGNCGLCDETNVIYEEPEKCEHEFKTNAYGVDICRKCRFEIDHYENSRKKPKPDQKEPWEGGFWAIVEQYGNGASIDFIRMLKHYFKTLIPDLLKEEKQKMKKDLQNLIDEL